MRQPHIDLDIVYHTDNHAVDDSDRYRAAAGWIANQFGLAELRASISLVDDPTIHELNREHLQHDWPTDVISFVFESVASDAGHRVDGEVIASIDTAARLSQAAGWSPADELLLYVIHGMLHLAGLDDLQPEQRAAMRAAEQACLLALGVAEAANHATRWEKVAY